MSEIEKLRWLADARAEYVHGPFETVEQFHSLSPVEQLIAREVMTVLCKLGLHSWPAHVNAYSQAPAPIRCERCGAAR